MVGAAIIAIFVAIFQYRGAKIEDLEEDVEDAERAAGIAAQVAANKEKVNDYELQNQVAAAKVQPKDYFESHNIDPEGKFYDI